MISQELIQRTKVNLQKLAEKMQGKFTASLEGGALFFSDDIGNLLMWIKDAGNYKIEIDPLHQFSNSIGRIYYEAFGEEMLIALDEDVVEKEYLFFDRKKRCWVNIGSTEELSAQLEALNIRIEQYLNQL